MKAIQNRYVSTSTSLRGERSERAQLWEGATLVLFLLIVVMLLTACGGDDNEYTFTSLEQSFENKCLEKRAKTAEIVEQMFVISPKFGRERMEVQHKQALAIMRRCDSVIAFVDSFKKILAKEKSSNVATGAFAKSLKDMLQPALLLHMVDNATHDSIDSVRLYDTIVSKNFDAFKNVLEWPELHFQGSAAKTQMELSRIKHDIAEAEWVALYKLIEYATRGCVLKFDPHMAAAIPMSSLLFVGDKFEANLLFLYRPDTPAYKVREMTMNGQKLEVINEVGHYSEIARRPGLHTVNGKVTVEGPDGWPMIRDVRAEYFVMEPIATVETESARTIFAGRHNPLSVNVVGFAQKDVIVQADKGTLTNSNGKYDLYIDDTGTVRIIVSTKLRSGKIMPIDTQFLQAIIHK